MVLTYITADECREQITTLLTDLGCTQAEVSVCVVDGRSNFSDFFFLSRGDDLPCRLPKTVQS